MSVCRSVVSDFPVTPWTVLDQAPLSMEFSRQEYWSGLPFPSPQDLPDRGIKAGSRALQADSLLSGPPGKPKYPVLAKLSVVSLCDPVDCSPLDPLSMRFFRQEYQSGLPFPSLGDIPSPGIEP